ncbi:hypothetical protein IIC44_02105 [Patescibacteria group bacterium]|nr:hypothetical protein [Patescibacteria group bacterium]
MTRPLFSKSTRKYIRFQKARIRREILDFKKQKELIQELHQRFVGKSKKKEEKAKKVEEKPKKAAVKKKETAAATK